MITFVTTSVLAISAPASEGERSFADTIRDISTANENFAREERQKSIMLLEGLLAQASQFPGQLPSDETPEPLLRAHVVLARLHLAEGDREAAEEALDEAIRSAQGQALPIRAYGPQLTQLYRERRAALEELGRATLAVECEVPCEVVINELRSSERERELYLGVYRVWLRAEGGDGEWSYREVELSTADARQVIEFSAPTPKPPVEAGPAVLDLKPVDLPAQGSRRLPRAAEITGAALGVGLLVLGASLLSFDGKCERSKQRPEAGTTPEQCGDIYESSAAGGSLLGIGAGLLVVSGVMLAVDEVRVGRARGRQVMLKASLKF